MFSFRYWQIENGPKVYIDKVYLHPSYDRVNTTNNIALVRYCPTTHNASICVPRVPEKIAKMALPAGISNIIVGNNSQNITLTDTEKCAQKWARAELNVATDGSYICGSMQVVDSASHKSCTANLHGMPLLYSAPDAAGTFLRGILDIGKKDYCKDDGLPDVYIDVTYYADWITEQLESIRAHSLSMVKLKKMAYSNILTALLGSYQGGSLIKTTLSLQPEPINGWLLSEWCQNRKVPDADSETSTQRSTPWWKFWG